MAGWSGYSGIHEALSFLRAVKILLLGCGTQLTAHACKCLQVTLGLSVVGYLRWMGAQFVLLQQMEGKLEKSPSFFNSNRIDTASGNGIPGLVSVACSHR